MSPEQQRRRSHKNRKKNLLGKKVIPPARVKYSSRSGTYKKFGSAMPVSALLAAMESSVFRRRP